MELPRESPEQIGTRAVMVIVGLLIVALVLAVYFLFIV